MGSFSELEDLIALSHKDSHEIVLELLVRLDEFSEFLKYPLYPDWIIKTIVILSKLCSFPFRQTKFTIVQVVVDNQFLFRLQTFLSSQAEEWQNQIHNEHYWNNSVEFLDNLDFIYKSILCRQSSPPEEQIINNFQTLSVYPTGEELLTRNSNVRTGDITEKKYDNVDHYLEEQFKLLRKPFVEPFRKEIAKYIGYYYFGIRVSKSPLMRVYPDAVFQSMDFECDKGGAILKFSEKKTVKEIFSHNSKCINLEVLLCFTKDNFSSVVVGRVIKKNYEENHLIIDFEDKFSCFDFNVSYTVLEYNVVFQETYFALKALQCMSKADFPMESYLIDAVPRVERPNYMDLNFAFYTIPGRQEGPLDATQYTAFKAALTQKFVMIQGAPGTGKTELGLEIVKTFLHSDNQTIWYNETPILIVCLSNQVLDTFLEGLISTTDRIIRVGNTKSENLKDFTLDSARMRNSADFDQENLILKLKNSNNYLNHIKDIKNIILNVKYFEVIDDNLKTSWFSGCSSQDFLEWLFDMQNTDPNSMEISQVLRQIAEERERLASLASLADNTEFNMYKWLQPYGLVLFSKTLTWFNIEAIIDQMQTVNPRTNEMQDKEAHLKYLWRNYQYFKIKPIDPEFSPAPTKPTNVDYQSPHSMDPYDRWNVYYYWLSLYKLYAEKQFQEIRTEIQNICDLKLMKRSLILGITINTAAKMRTTLQALNCRIVIVQEASDISESHTVLSLTKHCEHLILIGNQEIRRELTPVDNSNRCSDESSNIMKRMLHFKVEINTLGFQHRMRPEISQLLAPLFYPQLKNHHSVTRLPVILGIPFRVFFVNHGNNQEFGQYKYANNCHEAKFLINLARYLIKVGYAPKDITILTVYSGQTQILCNERRKYRDLPKGIEICDVATYKGEECKIILLSLVNNKEEKFVITKSESFINLALSRAREALYMIGNIEFLCEGSMVWREIEDVFLKQDCIADYFSVCCKSNPNHVTRITRPEDFDQVPEEVCRYVCGWLLNCGHACSRKCHNMQTNHTSLFCKKICKNQNLNSNC